MGFDHDCSSTYQPCVVADQYNDMRASIGDNMDASVCNPSTMQRFLSEPERPLFTSPFSDDNDPTIHPFPTLPVNPVKYIENDGYALHIQRRLPSPTNSGLASSYFSSSWSDRQETPWSSPETSADSYPLDPCSDGVPYASGGHSTIERHDSHVAMHDVQKCADQLPDTIAFEDMCMPYDPYGAFVSEGYETLQPTDDVASATSYSVPSSEYGPPPTAQRRGSASPVVRRRRAQASRTVPSPLSPSKVAKRPSAGRRASSYHSGLKIEDSSTNGAAVNRDFPCPLAVYGCPSTFGSKNEWKRHVNTQHMRLGFWRCDQCPNGDRKPNDFNRKDLFIQHVRRMHPIDTSRPASNKRSNSRSGKDNAEEHALKEASTRCYKHLRSSPEDSCCLFCDQHFHGHGTWDERLEHIGRHMESSKKEEKHSVSPQEWLIDEATQVWMIREQIIVPHGQRWVLSETRG